ncbi:hypothetical protein [Rhodococcus globerulus]|uniref:hypothetical protein n=1 Tax=Rhodococcus globerulus TaxID=33008 RepID=UPI000526F8C0|nr:hypothetical protein [Rhodococcus globerulus]
MNLIEPFGKVAVMVATIVADIDLETVDATIHDEDPLESHGVFERCARQHYGLTDEPRPN